MKNAISNARKFIVALCGALAMILSAGLIGGTAKTIVVGVLGFFTSIGVFVVPNATVSVSDSAASTQTQQQGTVK